MRKILILFLLFSCILNAWPGDKEYKFKVVESSDPMFRGWTVSISKVFDYDSAFGTYAEISLMSKERGIYMDVAFEGGNSTIDSLSLNGVYYLTMSPDHWHEDKMIDNYDWPSYIFVIKHSESSFTLIFGSSIYTSYRFNIVLKLTPIN